MALGLFFSEAFRLVKSPDFCSARTSVSIRNPSAVHELQSFKPHSRSVGWSNSVQQRRHDLRARTRLEAVHIKVFKTTASAKEGPGSRFHHIKQSNSGTSLSIAFGLCVVAAIIVELFDRPADGEAIQSIPYTPIGQTGDNFRVLVLSPGTGRESIKCELRSVLFADGPQYEALSYAWGDRTHTKPIHVNGVKVEITQSL
ncbi:hypothetical protein K402DRAFT_119054 [Aulographum hederae CBS 113979]|uniref:Heterokaryon incompatibility domain-containing protein n=1 Tax=Aulographum hederae CBS 113979 TaxID=1176131 RepID=A0A6G1GV45_9PEZI|nr:hypothetical protein K402DRAFT_119054 [Aulographum hederae CBS 113979]